MCWPKPWSCCTATVTADFTNVADVTGDDPNGDPVTDTDDAEVDAINPAIDIQKTPDLQTLVAGDDATFTITVTNDSTFEPVTLDALVDSDFGDLNGQGNCLADGSITLQPGETYTCSFVGAVAGSAGSTHVVEIRAQRREGLEMLQHLGLLLHGLGFEVD